MVFCIFGRNGSQHPHSPSRPKKRIAMFLTSENGVNTKLKHLQFHAQGEANDIFCFHTAVAEEIEEIKVARAQLVEGCDGAGTSSTLAERPCHPLAHEHINAKTRGIEIIVVGIPAGQMAPELASAYRVDI